MAITYRSLRNLIFITLLLITGFAGAQTRYQVIEGEIDSLAEIGLPKSALVKVALLDSQARKDNNAPQQIRAAIYRITFLSYLEEDALVSIISQLKVDISKADYPVKPVLQSLLAQMYWNYYQQNRYRFYQRSKLANAEDDFTNWDLQTLLNETSHLYDASLSNAPRLFSTAVGVLTGVLEGDSTTRILRPTLYDLLLSRAFEFYLTEDAGLPKPKLEFSLNDPRFFADTRTFARLTLPVNDTASITYKGLNYLQQAAQLHLQHNDAEALADLDLKRLSYLLNKSTAIKKDSLYPAALKKVAASFADKPVSATALELTGKYYQDKDSLVTAYKYYAQALAAFPKSVGGVNAGTFIRQLQQKELSATVEDVNIPGKPMLALCSFKNVTAADVTIYRLSQKQLAAFNLNDNDNQDDAVKELKYLADFQPVQRLTYNLINNADYANHTAEFKINPLSPGGYVLLIKDKASAGPSLTSLCSFIVSGMAYIVRKNPDDKLEMRIMDRETGKPLRNVAIDLTGQIYHYNGSVKPDYTLIKEDGSTNADGLLISEKFDAINNLSVMLTRNGDTLLTPSKYLNGIRENTRDDDDPEDKTVLFTDRQIYRPGQTIYFKALQLLILKGKSRIMPKRPVKVSFADVNGKELSVLNLETNDYGSVSGSFIIPQSMLNGDVELSTEDGRIEVKVEEYKRPTFQVTFEPVKKSYKLNDSVTINGNVKAFSGYGISAARVAVHITRSINLPVFISNRRNAYRPYNYNAAGTEIMTDTLITDDQGHFKITFKAEPADVTDAGSQIFNYSLNADITDAAGETRSANTVVNVGNHDIELNSYLPELIFAKDSLKAAVNLANLNGQLQKGNIRVSVYRLQQPIQIFKDRLWAKPDDYILDKTVYKTDFPDYAFKDEDLKSSWPKTRLVLSQDVAIDTLKRNEIDLTPLAKQPSGTYQLLISARNDKGDTVSKISYISFVNGPPKPTSFNDWVIPTMNEVNSGDSAEFLTGINQKVNVLMERYNGPNKISSQWLTINAGIDTVKVPVSPSDKNVAVQFMMVYQNRLYSSYQRIYMKKPDETLKLKFLTYRNKLQPGEKEQWKLQVTDAANKAQMAELVATLYDASLDDITPPVSWTGALKGRSDYVPNYFEWEKYGFLTATGTRPVFYDRSVFNILPVDYERLDLFGYNYYGGYNSGYQQYLQKIKTALSNAELEKILEANYHKYAERIKSGYDVKGRVIDANDKSPVIGVSVKIKGLNIGTITNAYGYFHIKVPKDAKLVVSFIGYETQTQLTTHGGDLTIMLKASDRALNEVVVTGHQTQRKTNVTASASQIVYVRGVSSLPNSLEGKVYGLQVADPGVKHLNTAMGINTNSSLGYPPIALRTNFNETAFFYPQLLTDAKGQTLIEFTIPEALTRWKFRGFAHTKDLKTGYIENTVVTQKQLSIGANMPRFMREGDTLTVAARLTNLTKGKLRGKVQLQLLNAVNMQPVHLLINAQDAEQKFEINANTNKAISFRLVVPAGFDALTYRLTAEAGNYTDGEENTIPVLPKRMLVTESMPMLVRAGQTKDFSFDKLVNQRSKTLQNKTLTLEYTQNPAWYAVQALPYMMEFPYECSEQVFSRYFANSLAMGIINKMPAIRQVFDQWKSNNSGELSSNLDKNQELKETLIEETPWLQDAENENEQKKRIALLFDMNKMSNELNDNLQKLEKRQLPDGGFPWFGGEYADRYITQHILAGIGELEHTGLIADEIKLKPLANKALKYLEKELITDARNRKKEKGSLETDLSDLEIHAWYTLSYFTDEVQGKELKGLLTAYLQLAAGKWVSRNVYEQGMMALTLARFDKPDITMQIERSLLERAQQTDELGMYWAGNRQGYYWYESPVETQSLLIELFTEAGTNIKAVDEMKVWLLRNKQTNDWKTTKATASACYALLLKGSNLLSNKGAANIIMNGKPLIELKPDIKADAGTGYIKTSWAGEQIKPGLGKVQISNNGTGVTWGALHWQYLEELDNITTSHTNISLERKYFIQKQTGSGPVLTLVDASHQPKTGDLLQVVVHLKADRDFEYVQLKDMRPAGTEPVDALSAYKSQDGLYYYEVSKDAATNFFISELSKGNYVFEYRLRVAQPGHFSTGITNLQCMYAPEFNAHSAGERMLVRP